jgi:NADH dehydrogenase FAD-containing subunit
MNKTLAHRTDIEVTMISRENFILFTPMLHEVAAGEPAKEFSRCHSRSKSGN